jgi:hypothetical protein
VLGADITSARQAKTTAITTDPKESHEVQAIGGILLAVGLSTLAIERYQNARRLHNSDL